MQILGNAASPEQAVSDGCLQTRRLKINTALLVDPVHSHCGNQVIVPELSALLCCASRAVFHAF